MAELEPEGTSVTILDAMHDPQLFGPWFGRDATSWRAWRVFLAALLRSSAKKVG